MIKNKKKRYTKKTKKENYCSKYKDDILGIIFITLGVILLVSFLDINKTGQVGYFIKNIFIGLLGAMAVFVPIYFLICGVCCVLKKTSAYFKVKMFYLSTLIILMCAIISIGDYNKNNYSNMGLGKFLVELWKFEFCGNGDKFTGGGFLGSLISYPIIPTFGEVGAIIIFTALTIINLVIFTNVSISRAYYALKDGCMKITNRVKNIFMEAKTMEKEGSKVIDFNKLREKRFKSDTSNSVNATNNNIKELENENVIKFKGKIFEGGTHEEPNNQTESDKSLKNKKDKMDGEQLKNIEKEIVKDITLNNDKNRTYIQPDIELLNKNIISNINVKNLKEVALEGAKKLEETLKSFGVNAKVVNISKGPAITRYELQPNVGVKVSRILNLADDIALNLATTGIRMEAPIPGKAAIGIEVPNKECTPVYLREVLDSPEFKKNVSKISFALGKDVSGENIVADIAKMPHVLIAGATGSGKSVCINTLIISLLYGASPEEVRLLMVDPKVVELGIYNGIPHLLIPVVTDAKKAAGALNWAVQEMINRYKIFAEKGVRDIRGYNASVNGTEEKKLPQIVIIIDELADLMMVAPHEVEDAICRLAQMARAAGMHLVIATQRPSVDVITGVIKANIPSRIAFSVSSQVDSRTIIDMAGAEKLLGKGDMLFYPVGEPKPIRVKGSFVSDKEVEKIVEFVKSTADVSYDEKIINQINSPAINDSAENVEKGDELLEQAIEIVVDMGQASVSLIQRKLKVGYARAARIVDQMEEKGVVGEYEGSKPRQVRWTKQMLNEMKMSEDLGEE